MRLLGEPSTLLLQRRLPTVKVTGRCFLLRPRCSTTASFSANSSTSSVDAMLDVECVELTQGDSPASRRQHRFMPGSLMGNSYYAERYKGGGSAGHRAMTSTVSPLRFFNGDLVLRLCRSAVPRELSHKRIVDVTGSQTSFLDSSERDRRALATVDEALATMHLHDGHEVPALQRGDVDLMRLQPQCVYALPSTFTSGKVQATGAAMAPSFDLASLASVLCPLDNPSVLLAQSRRLTFRSEMEAMQVARVMAASVWALENEARTLNSTSSSGAVLKPVVRDGHLISVTLRLPHGPR